MLRVLAGVVTGGVVSVAILAVVSVTLDLSERAARREAAPDAGELRVPPGSGFGGAREDREAALPRVGEGPALDAAPRLLVPAPDDTGALDGADTAPSRSPGVGAGPSLGAPAESASGAAPRAAEPAAPAGRAPLPAPPAAPTRDAPADGADRPSAEP